MSKMHEVIVSDPRFLMAYDPSDSGGRSTRYVFIHGEASEKATLIGRLEAIEWIIENPPTAKDWLKAVQDTDRARSGAELTAVRHQLFPCPTCVVRESRQDHAITTHRPYDLKEK